MDVSRPLAGLLALCALALTIASFAGACGGGSPAGGLLSSPADLAGRTVSTGSLSSVSAFELRYVLLQAYSLDARARDGDVSLSESPGDSLAQRLRSGDVDAVLATAAAAFELSENEDFTVLSHVSEDMRKLIKTKVVASLLVTYSDVLERAGPDLTEIIRMLAESAAYFEANRSTVIDAVAAEQDLDPDFLRWWWERHELALGQASEETQQQIQAIWEAAKTLGDIETYPSMDDLTFVADDASAEKSDGTVHATISLALLDDPSRRAALYAIEQGLVTSTDIDVNITYLSQSEIEAAATTKQYNVIEAVPLAVPRASGEGSELAIVSAAFLDIDGALLFVRRAR